MFIRACYGTEQHGFGDDLRELLELRVIARRNGEVAVQPRVGMTLARTLHNGDTAFVTPTVRWLTRLCSAQLDM